jgi:hypothetical protein
MSREIPLAPQHLPVLGHMALLLTGAPWDVMEAWLRERGPTLRFKIPGATYIASSDPEVVRHVLLGNADNYVKDIRSHGPLPRPARATACSPATGRCGSASGRPSPRPSASTRSQRRRRDAPRRRPRSTDARRARAPRRDRSTSAGCFAASPCR